MTGAKLVVAGLGWLALSAGLAVAQVTGHAPALPAPELPRGIVIDPGSLSVPMVALMAFYWLRDWVRDGIPVTVRHVYESPPRWDDEATDAYRRRIGPPQ